ncbi:MAG: DUF945 family protein [Gammaproteobacteria bacterium]
MKKRLLIGLFAFLVLGSLPYLSGLIVEYQLNNFIGNLALPEGVSVKVDGYHVRYARSWAQIEITATKPAYPDMPFASFFKYTGDTHVSYIRLKIFHGPIFPKENDRLTMGLGRIAFYAKANDLAPANAILQDSLENFFEKNEIIAGNATLTLLGNLDIDFATAPAYYKSDEGSLSFEGVTGKASVSTDLNRIKLDLHVSPLLLQGKHDSMIDMAAMTLASEGERSKNSPWVGKQTMSLPSFYLRDEAGNTIRFNQFTLDTASHVKSGLANITLNAAANDVEFFNEKFINTTFKLIMDKLDAKGLADFSRISHHQDELSEGDWQVARRNALIDMFKKGAELSLIYTLTVEQGKVLAEAQVQFPDLHKEEGTPEHFAQQMILKMKASLSLHAPLMWMEDTLYRMALPHIPADAPPVTDPHTKQTIPAREALRMEISDQFNALNEAQVLITDQGNSAFNLRYEGGKILLNGKSLTPEDLVKLMSILDPQ